MCCACLQWIDAIDAQGHAGDATSFPVPSPSPARDGGDFFITPGKAMPRANLSAYEVPSLAAAVGLTTSMPKVFTPTARPSSRRETYTDGEREEVDRGRE